jgi:hypothetical protein
MITRRRLEHDLAEIVSGAADDPSIRPRDVFKREYWATYSSWWTPQNPNDLRFYFAKRPDADGKWWTWVRNPRRRDTSRWGSFRTRRKMKERALDRYRVYYAKRKPRVPKVKVPKPKPTAVQRLEARVARDRATAKRWAARLKRAGTLARKAAQALRRSEAALARAARSPDDGTLASVRDIR